MDNRIYNRANAANSLQISIMGKVEAVAEFSIPNGMGGKMVFIFMILMDELLLLKKWYFLGQSARLGFLTTMNRK